MPPKSPRPPDLSFSRAHLVPGARLTVAISGGADSTALLRVLHAANSVPRDALGIGLSALHIHHGLRGAAADRDQHFVTGLCAALAIPLHVRAVNTPAHAASTGETIEEAARTLRYALFRDLLLSGEADLIATAHTADDQAETVLLKLLRGAWTEGLAGIFPAVEVPRPPRSPGQILRPLLQTSRADLELYLHALGQPWVEDETNTDPAFTRNRLRHTLLPALREFNPSLDTALGNLSTIARDEEAFWQAEIARLLPQLILPGKPVRGGGRSNSTDPATRTVAVELERLRPLAPALRRRLLRALARTLGVSLTFPETERLLAFGGLAPALSTVPTKPGTTLVLSNGLAAERSLRELRLSRST